MAVRLFISGGVQGVGYRYSCRETAGRLGVRGWVRNLPDGRVEVLADAAPDTIERFIEWCRAGPPGAVVKNCRVDPVQAGNVPQGFQVKL